MSARFGCITISAMSARTSIVGHAHAIRCLRSTNWPVLIAIGWLLSLAPRSHSITVEPPPLKLTVDQYRGAFDPTQAPAVSFRRTRTASPTPLPPQLAYYAKAADQSPATVSASDYYAGTGVRHVHHHQQQQHPIHESDVSAVIEAPSTRIIVRDFAPIVHSLNNNHYPTRLVSLSQPAQRYRNGASGSGNGGTGDRLIIRTFGILAPHRPQHHLTFRPTPTVHNRPAAYVQKPISLSAHGLVRATNPPPGPNDPPPPKPPKPYTPTYQIDQQLRKYRQQQLVDQRSPKTKPHYRNGAMHEVQPPNLKLRERPLRTQIQRLKEQQRTHFDVAADEHPAAAAPDATSNEIHSSSDGKYGAYAKGREGSTATTFRPSHQGSGGRYNKSPKDTTQFRPSQQVSAHPTAKHKYAGHIKPTAASKYSGNYHPKLNHETTTTTSGYEALRDSVSKDIDSSLSAYQTDFDSVEDKYNRDYDPLQYHSDPFESNSNYKNLLSNEDDDDSSSEESDATSRNYNFKRTQQSAPKFIKPVKYSSYIDRSYTKPPTTEATSANAGSDNAGEEFVPYRMLATVRHTENIRHRPRPVATAGNDEPAVREKIHVEGGHIVYSEQGYEDEQYDHGDEEREGTYKKITKRSRRSTRSSADYPYYFASPHVVPELSALRYSSDEGRRARRAQRFYDTKTSVSCDDIDFDEDQVTDRPADIKNKQRLRGLGDKLDCLRRKYFGSDPLSNPIFKERYVSDQTELRSAGRRYKRDVDINATSSNDAPSSSVNVTIPGAAAEALVHTVPHVHDMPTVILLNARALARVRANPSMPLADILSFPEVEESEVFMFDVAKFVPRLFVNTDARDVETLTATAGAKVAVAAVAPTKPADGSGRKRKYVRTAFKNRRPNHNYSKAKK